MPETSHFAVVVRCADPRLEPYFADPDLRGSMGLACDREPLGEAHIAAVGGLVSFAGEAQSRLVDDIALLVRLYRGERSCRIVLTSHSTCGGYAEVFRGDEATIRDRQQDDLRSIAAAVAARMPEADVTCYHIDLDARCVTVVSMQ